MFVSPFLLHDTSRNHLRTPFGEVNITKQRKGHALPSDPSLAMRSLTVTTTALVEIAGGSDDQQKQAQTLQCAIPETIISRAIPLASKARASAQETSSPLQPNDSSEFEPDDGVGNFTSDEPALTDIISISSSGEEVAPCPRKRARLEDEPEVIVISSSDDEA
ncbi:hypothetical protein HGRIS_014861 [Hohenbuehelia grisea]|uniref:Uncharacterized protein n=1 Tax=Hohenbuehelia grisea TaxID=104357 RepID=A0ABR3IQZ6_9AGAR